MTDTPEAAKITVAYDQFQISSMMGWIETNGYKPHLHVLTGYPGTRLPPTSMAKPMEVINGHSDAVHKMQWHDDRVEFNARFGGKDHRLIIPYRAIRAIGFAHTTTAVALPWVNDPLPVAESALDPVLQQVGEALTTKEPETFTNPETSSAPAEETLTEEAAPKSNVRSVDFRAPRKPKN